MSDQNKRTISLAEQASREEAINFARGSVRFEGIVLPKEIENLNQAFINGEISDEEHSNLCMKYIDSL